jgi:hypothetical protein
MVITNRASRLTLCALVALAPLGSTLADSPAIKPAIVGLISTGSANNTLDELSIRQGVFGGLVVQVLWSQLQPNSSSDFDTTVIDQALAAVSQYNLTAAQLPAPNNRQVGVRLRVFSGCYAPNWAESLGGSGFPISTSHYNGTSTVNCSLGPFWDSTSSYTAAWRQLQVQLAAKYDTNPLVQEVAVTSCTSYTAEPFYLPNDATTVVQPLLDSGYSDAAYQQCLENAVADYAPWQTTRLEFTFNPFTGLSLPESDVADVALSERVMRECRQTVGRRCILSNHDLDTTPPSAGTILPLYALERKLGPNITFQTYVVAPADYEGTLRRGISLGAGSIEIWQEPKGFEAQSIATLQNWASMFVPQ